jgi:phospholipid/cholesterol/gamma-HCH transport system substrate-binding protein
VKPNHFDQLRSGLQVFEDRHCGAGVPNITNLPPEVPLPTPIPLPELPLDQLVPDDLLQRIARFAFAGVPGGAVPAPPCRSQGRFNFGGEVTQYPHVTEQR